MADDDTRFEQRMSDTDALMWSIETDPMLRSTIASVLILDRDPDRDRLIDKVERAARLVTRLRQRVMANTFSIAPPRWEVDPNFDLDYHLRFIGAPGAGTLSDVLAVAEPFVMSGFDLARPLWEIVVVEGMAGGQAAVVIKLHHTITDGVGAVKLAMHLFDLDSSPPEAGPMPSPPDSHVMGQWERMLDAWAHEQRRALGIATRAVPVVAGGLTRLLWDPIPTVARVGEVAGSVGRALSPSIRPLSPVMTGRSLSVRLDTLVVPLAGAKAAALSADARINDFFLAGVLGGLRRYHDLHRLDGDTPEALRLGMPISIRNGATTEAGGNHFVPTRFIAPLQIDDPAERMRALRALVAEQRAEPALDLVDALSAVARHLPRAAQVGLLGGLLRSVDVIGSNVPGVPFPLFMGGAQMVAQYAFGPRSGAAVNITLLSYLDRLYIGVNTDPAAIPDGAELVACLRVAFDELLELSASDS